MKAIKDVSLSRHDRKYKKQRDAAIYLVKRYSDLASDGLSKELSAVCGEKIGARSIRYAISNITKEKANEVD